MSLDWTPYNNFNWNSANQGPMDVMERQHTEQVAAKALGIIGPIETVSWGTASPPGRFASTVIRVNTGVEHAFLSRTIDREIEQIGIKIYKSNGDAQREFAKVLPLHNELLNRLPGLPHPLIQRTLLATWELDTLGRRRGALVQEWVSGDTLDVLLATHASASTISTVVARSILEQMFGQIIIPLWSRGLIWWDIRDANWCFDSCHNRLRLIDVDSLGAYAPEILENVSWTRREKGRNTALSRLKQTVWRVVQTQVAGSLKKAKDMTNESWERLLEPQLRRLGHEVSTDVEALKALESFLLHLAPAIG